MLSLLEIVKKKAKLHAFYNCNYVKIYLLKWKDLKGLCRMKIPILGCSKYKWFFQNTTFSNPIVFLISVFGEMLGISFGILEFDT